jgi:hypothetical protein
LEKIKKRKDRREHADWKLRVEKQEREEWEKQRQMREYLRDKGEEE